MSKLIILSVIVRHRKRVGVTNDQKDRIRSGMAGQYLASVNHVAPQGVRDLRAQVDSTLSQFSPTNRNIDAEREPQSRAFWSKKGVLGVTRSIDSIIFEVFDVFERMQPSLSTVYFGFNNGFNIVYN